MNLTRRSSLGEVAAAVASALSDAGVRSVLTGGACASLYTRGACQSSDLDFVIQSSVSQAKLEAAMAAAGFARRGNQFVHPRVRFFVEFPAGPLAIGSDLEIQPIEYRVRRRIVLALSPTDSCCDRLATFHFWTDRQSLRTAVQIALRHPVDLETVRRWRGDEGLSAAFEEFARELERARSRRRNRGG